MNTSNLTAKAVAATLVGELNAAQIGGDNNAYWGIRVTYADGTTYSWFNSMTNGQSNGSGVPGGSVVIPAGATVSIQYSVSTGVVVESMNNNGCSADTTASPASVTGSITIKPTA